MKREFVRVSISDIPFFKFEKRNQSFEGRFIGIIDIPRMTSKGVKTMLLFEDYNKEKVYISPHYDIMQSVKREGIGFYKIIYKGQITTGNNRKAVYEIYYSIT